MHSRLVVLATSFFAFVACSERPSPSAKAPTEPAPAASASAKAPVASWKEPAAIDELLSKTALPVGKESPRSCYYAVPEQSCIPGSEAFDWSCRSDCGAGCEKCSAACTKPLAGCVSACKDEGCARACATTAGACLDACLGERDKCAGQCVKELAAYEKERADNFGCKDKTTRVLDLCKRAVACVEKCPEKTHDACAQKCKSKHAPGCNANIEGVIDSGMCNTLDDSP